MIMIHRTLLFLFLLCGLTVQSQTMYIPDLVLRAAMNAAKPNSVDVSGQCDTTLWNAQPPNEVELSIHSLPDGTIVDLENIQYLKMGKLTIRNGQANHISVNWSGYPRNITQLELGLVDVGLFTGSFLSFPPSLDYILCQTCGLGTLPPFSGTRMMYIDEDLGGQTLTVPPSVTSLALFSCNLTWLPAVPNVQLLTVDNNPLPGNWPNMPEGLLQISAVNTGMTSLPTIPSTLMTLVVTNNSLTSLPPLPSTLQILRASRNQITVLPPVPAVLGTLDVSYNPIPVLPPMSGFLSSLNVDSCGMSEINYPGGLLVSLNANNNPITSLPPFNVSTHSVSVANCPLLTCLPPLPSALTGLNVAGSGVTCLPNIPPGLNTSNIGIPPVLCNITTGPCPVGYPVITGTTFQDWDNNGEFDSFEQVRAHGLVLAQPGDLLTASDINGNFTLPADLGSFTVTGVPGLYEPVTTSPYTVNLSQSSQSPNVGPIGFYLETYMPDLVTTLVADQARPGFNTEMWVHVNNVGTYNLSAPVQLTFDPALTYLSSNIAPQGINNNVLVWDMPWIQPGETWSVRVSLYAPPTLALGTAIMHTATATSLEGEMTPADNTAVLNDVVVGSFDPNDKRVEPELLMQQDITAGTRVNYTIRFQNTGTFSAERVLITDTLPAGVQAATMQLTGTSHACTWYIRHRVLHVFYNGINLPDSTNDEANSHGYVSFSIMPSASLTVGDAVENVANIYFDFNEPVITEPAIFYVETGLSVQQRESRELRTWPNPANGQLMVGSSTGLALGSLSVLDLQGRVVLQLPAFTGNLHAVDVTGIAAGTYLLKAHTANGILSTRFVKQ